MVGPAAGRLCSWNLYNRCTKEGLSMVGIEFNNHVPLCHGDRQEDSEKTGGETRG
jgi:hypothetical protein